MPLTLPTRRTRVLAGISRMWPPVMNGTGEETSMVTLSALVGGKEQASKFANAYGSNGLVFYLRDNIYRFIYKRMYI